jgi:hypothetical protein
VVVPHGEAAAKEWTSFIAWRVEGWRSNGCLVELLNVSELEYTCCILALEGQWKLGKGIVGRNEEMQWLRCDQWKIDGRCIV